MKLGATPVRGITLCASALLVAASVAAAPPETPASSAQVRVPLAEARRMAHMMNDIYITAVLTTHRMYIHDAGTPSAVTWAKQVARQVAAHGWPAAHIFTTTDRPLNPENAAADAFERAAVEAFKSGKTAYEKTEPGALRYATSIAVVDKSCLVCHVRNQEGDLLGGVSFRVLLTPAASTAK